MTNFELVFLWKIISRALIFACYCYSRMCGFMRILWIITKDLKTVNVCSLPARFQPKIFLNLFQIGILGIFHTIISHVKFQFHCKIWCLGARGTFTSHSCHNGGGNNLCYIVLSCLVWKLHKQSYRHPCVILISGKAHILCSGTLNKL